MSRPVVALLSSLLIAMAACGNDGPGAPTPDGSGIRGVVTSGPQCPVALEGSPCPDRPWRGTVRVSDADGQVVEVSTDAGGTFLVALAPGMYDVLPVVEGSGPGFARPQRVRVTDGAVADVTLTVDSGIR